MLKKVFEIEKRMKNCLGRAGIIYTPHGDIKTPAFVVVGTKATVKGINPDQLSDIGSQVVLANTYHLYLAPGDSTVKKFGGLGKYMGWKGPTMTDSGGFQVFSLGHAYKNGISKIIKKEDIEKEKPKNTSKASLVKIDEDGVFFKSIIDGSQHRFTPEKSIDVQNNIGADIIFAFDECTSPISPYEYQKSAMERTHRWAIRSLNQHKLNGADKEQMIFGIVQGGRFRDLREQSAEVVGKMDFDGFGIGGSFDKEDMSTSIMWVNNILPEDKPRHLLGIGEPADILMAILNGADTFDCVAPTRMGRTGTFYTENGRINISNSKHTVSDLPIDANCKCYSCKNFTRGYIAHLFRVGEMLGPILGSIHNIHFITNMVESSRIAIINDSFIEYKENFIKKYYHD